MAATIAVVLFVIYLVASWRERGRDPQYRREVYFYRGPEVAARALGAGLASEAQVRVYARSGGGARGPGLVRGGRVLRLGPASSAPPAPRGVWLYGPKPRRGTPGVAPFRRGAWFQP